MATQIWLLVILATFCDGSLQESCLSSCSDSSLWSYQVGKVYSYNYKVSVVTKMKGNSDEDSRLTISARANFYHSTSCNFDMQVIVSL